TSLDNGFGELGDFGLPVEGDVTRNLAQRAGAQTQSGGDFGDAIAMRVPGNRRQREAQIVGQGFGDFRPAATESGKGADGAAELQRQHARLDFGEPLAMARNSVEPAGHDEAKGSGQGLLHPRASDNGSGTMRFGKRDEGSREASQVLIDEIERAADLQNTTSIDSILAGGAPMNEARRVFILVSDKFGEFPDKWNGQIAGQGGVFGDSGEIEILRAAPGGDDLRLGYRNNSGCGFGAGKSGFKIEHALDAGFVGKKFIQGVAAK